MLGNLSLGNSEYSYSEQSESRQSELGQLGTSGIAAIRGIWNGENSRQWYRDHRNRSNYNRGNLGQLQSTSSEQWRPGQFETIEIWAVGIRAIGRFGAIGLGTIGICWGHSPSFVEASRHSAHVYLLFGVFTDLRSRVELVKPLLFIINN